MLLLIKVCIVNLIDSPIPRPILADVLAHDLVFLRKDLIFSSGFFVIASDHEFLASGWLGSLQGHLSDFLQPHSNGQKRLENTIVELEPLRFVPFIDLCQHLEALVEVETVLGLSHDESE